MFRVVHNVLHIRGTLLEVDRCIEQNTALSRYTNQQVFCFNALVPESLIIPSSEKWRIDNWGCDTEIAVPIDKIIKRVRVYDNKFVVKTIIFDTHKTPPLKWLKTLSKQFPNLSFELVCDPGWKWIIPIPRFYRYYCEDGIVMLDKRDSLDFFRYNYLVNQK